MGFVDSETVEAILKRREEERRARFLTYAWYCPKCDRVYLHPDDDVEHEAWHESVEVYYPPIQLFGVICDGDR